MKDKIREFLASSGGQASAVAIARKVLHLTHASPVTVDRLLSSLLKNDPAFAADGMGNWYLLSAAAATHTEAAAKVFLVGTPMQPQEIAQAQSIVLGWAAFDEASETSMTSAEIVFPSASLREEESYPRMTREEFVARFAAPFTDSILVSWQPHAITQAWYKIFFTKDQPWFSPTTISLSVLARNVLGLNRRPALPALYRQLCGAQTWRESFADNLQAQNEILRVLLAKCREQGINDWHQITAFARRARRADFSQYAFDEKFVDRLPETPGVYVMRDANNRVVYVGKAANLRMRVRSYFQSPTPEERKLQHIRTQIVALHFEIVDTELDALLREHRLIRRFKPQVNRQRKIFPQIFPQSAHLQSIFLVPVHPKAPATKGRVIVYLLSPQSLKRYSVRIGRKPGARLHRALAEFYAEVASPMPKGECLANDESARLEIAARWLQQNAERINVLDPADCAEVQELEKRLHLLLRSPETMTAKFHFIAGHNTAHVAA